MTTPADILDDFARRTGLVGDAPPRRYLWTDAFAVCACLALHRREIPGEGAGATSRWLDLAIRLVEQVHRVLGRHRPDDPRTGWISGLDEEEGSRHPTAGGLRIGKPLPERGRGEPSHARLEWDQDGQYYHYLTRWMHALSRVAGATRQRRYYGWAVELATVAHGAFVGGDEAGPWGMYWKMSVDLSRPLVRSMGSHDPLDGLLTLRALRTTALAGAAEERAATEHAPPLDAAVRDLARMCRGRDWTTDDALGIGGLLVAAHTARLLEGISGTDAGAPAGPLPSSVAPDTLLRAAARSLDDWEGSGVLERPDAYRLPFREIGLAIGLVATLDTFAEPPPELRRGRGLIDAIRDHWTDPKHQTGPTWVEHEDINAVMLATLLAPEEYLAL